MSESAGPPINIKIEDVEKLKDLFKGFQAASNDMKAANQGIIRVLENDGGLESMVRDIANNRFKGEVLGTMVTDCGIVIAVVVSFGCVLALPWILPAVAGALVVVGQAIRIGAKYYEVKKIKDKGIVETINRMLESRKDLLEKLKQNGEDFMKMSKELGVPLTEFETLENSSSIFSLGDANMIAAPFVIGALGILRNAAGAAGCIMEAITPVGAICATSGVALVAGGFIVYDLYSLIKDKNKSETYRKIQLIKRDLKWEIDYLTAIENKMYEIYHEDTKIYDKVLDQKIAELRELERRLVGSEPVEEPSSSGKLI